MEVHLKQKSLKHTFVGNVLIVYKPNQERIIKLASFVFPSEG